MKTRRLLASLLACLLTISLFAPTASAYYYGDSAEVYVDDVRVRGIDAYVDDNGDIRVSSHEDLVKIFPNDLVEGIPIVYNPDEGILVEDYANEFGYYCLNRRTTLYIYTNYYDNHYPSRPSSPSRPSYPSSQWQLAKVFVNGLYVATNSVYVNGNSTTFYGDSTLRTLFPKETGSSFLIFPDEIELSVYAKRFGYSMVVSGNRIYLNNDGNSPVEVRLNGELINFPDQQPMVVRPGRTMVPVRTIAELVNCDVKWNTEKKCAQITKANSTMYIWPGATRYWLNGTYHDMDVAAYVTNGRTMVPLRFIAEAFGYTVNYYNNGVFTVTLES